MTCGVTTSLANLADVEDLAVNAAVLARRYLDTAELADRWLHVQAVARRAESLTPAVAAADRDLIITAAWLHDLGYAPELVATGMHSIDGARYLLRCGYPLRLAALVAHHSGARFEATERGLLRELDEFPFEAYAVADALATADLTTGPQGQPMSFQARMQEILDRYPPTSPVHKAMRNAQPELMAQVQRTMDRLTRASDSA